MSAYCNGVKKVPNNTAKSRRSSEPVFSDPEEEIAKIGGFRGFDKQPRVLLPRYDISPYLNSRGKQCINTDFASVYLTEDPLKLNSLLNECSVKLIKQDLVELKGALVNGSPRSDVSVGDLDESMASLKCKICEKVYASERKLLNHQQNKHMIVYKPEPKPQKRVSFSDHIIVHEVKEYHKCRKCTKIFEDYKSLKSHMKHKHKKRKCYICNYCNKNFVDRMFFKVHIKLHCDVCGVLFPNKSKYVNHKRNICRTFKLHKCRTCNLSFFRFMDLKDHSYDHLSTYFICDICKDQFSSKCAVSHHISYLHSRKRPTALYMMRNLGTERLYLCNFCDESSVDRDIIEAHVQILPDLTNRAMTGYKDFYFCDQCLKKFGTEQDMLQHKWTHFLKTSDNSQVRPKSILSKKKDKFRIPTTFKLSDKIPDYMLPTIVLEKIDLGDVNNMLEVSFNVDGVTNGVKKTIINRKTLISKHQCQMCGKYYSSNYCLNRHIETQHTDYENLRCKVCEETFVWPSLLQSHRCIRLNLPEMPFDDARPEIHFDNLSEINQNGFDDLNIDDNDDYMSTVDFEIPAPIVELTEGTNAYMNNVNCVSPLQSLGYKVVMQEVPIEF